MDKIVTKTALATVVEVIKGMVDEKIGDINTILESINGN